MLSTMLLTVKKKRQVFLVNYEKNTAFDFGTAKKYDNVSLVQGIKKCSVSKHYSIWNDLIFQFQLQKQRQLDRSNLNPNQVPIIGF